VLIRIPEPIADDQIGAFDWYPDRGSEITFVDPFSGVVVVVDRTSDRIGGGGGAASLRDLSWLWHSLLARGRAAATALLPQSLIAGFGRDRALAVCGGPQPDPRRRSPAGPPNKGNRR
jgi:hypothetical protein